MRAMARARVLVAAGAAGCAVVGIAAIVLSASRISVALAGLVVALALVFPRQTVRGRLLDVVAMAVLLGAAGFGAHLALGGHTPVNASGEAGRLLLLLVIVGASATTWGIYRDVVGRPPLPTPRRLPGWAAIVVVAGALALAVVAGLLSASALGNRTAAHGS